MVVQMRVPAISLLDGLQAQNLNDLYRYYHYRRSRCVWQKFLSCYNNPDRHTGQKTEAENIIRETRPLPPALYILTNRIAVNGADKWYIAVVILGKDFLWHRTVRNHRNVS